MNFGQDFICNICKEAIDDDYHRYTCDIAGINYEFYTCKGECNKKFRGEYIDPFADKPPLKRWQILDLRED